MKKRVAIIGHFGGKEGFLDGQTVKTRTLYDELNKKTNWDIQRVDTYWKSTRPIKLLFQTLFALITRKDVIVLLSGNGMKAFFPFLYWFTRHFQVRVFHDVIGGNLDQYITNNPKFRKYLNSFVVNWVETNSLSERLKTCGINNCVVIPNFKRLCILPSEKIKTSFSEPYKFCTFSRVMKEKGIESAISAIERINRHNKRTVCLLDIYGVIDQGYGERFRKVINDSSQAIKYCGSVPYQKSVETISEYFGLLFPTYWKGEGFPGTIIDAFSAGIPVIASDWAYNSELVVNGINGMVYSMESGENLDRAIMQLIDIPPKELKTIRENCIRSAEKYQPDVYIEAIINSIVSQSN